MPISIVLLITFISILLGYFYYRIEYKEIRNEKGNDLKAISEQKLSELRLWIKERKADASVISADPHIEEEIGGIIDESSSQSNIEKLKDYLSKIQTHYEYHSVIITDIEGNHLLSEGYEYEHISGITKEKITDCIKAEV